MASIQARHSRSCEIGGVFTTFEKATREHGCTCTPLYYVAAHVGSKLVRERVGRNRKNAMRALNKIQVRVDDEAYQEPKNITFRVWADEWHAKLRRPSENTTRSYVSTLDYGKRAFGDKLVRKLSLDDIDEFLGLMGKRSASTQAKHLRVLSACLDAAVSRDYASGNPVRRMEKSERPKTVKPKPSYYTSAELSRLWKALPETPPASVYRALCQAAVTTGMRQGELVGLRWNDVRFLDKEIVVRGAYTPGVGFHAPKSGRQRTVDMTPDAEAVFTGWYQSSGSPGDGDALVFPHYDGGYLVNATITRTILYPALTRAGIPRVGEKGGKRDFHSFRHSFARVALEQGAKITWVQKQLGHSSIQMTVDVYGDWERKAEKQQAAEIKAGAFPV